MTALALVTLERHFCSQGTLNVWLVTTGGSATNDVNYLAVTNKLTWNSGDVQPKTVAIPILEDAVVEPADLVVNLSLLSPTVNKATNSIYFGSISNALLTIVNTDSRGQVAFASPTYFVNENGGAATHPARAHRRFGSSPSRFIMPPPIIPPSPAAAITFPPAAP